MKSREDATYAIRTGLTIELAAKSAEPVVEQFDHREVVAEMHGRGDVVTHGVDVSGRYVGAHGLNLGPHPRHTFPEDFQGFTAFAVAHEHDGAGEQVEHNCQELMPCADVDFIDGDLLELVQFRICATAAEVLGLNRLDGAPADFAMLGNILDGHTSRQLQGVVGRQERCWSVCHQWGACETCVLSFRESKHFRSRTASSAGAPEVDRRKGRCILHGNVGCDSCSQRCRRRDTVRILLERIIPWQKYFRPASLWRSR